MPFPLFEEPNGLGFSYRSRKNGDVEVLHYGRVAATLRGLDARALVAEVVDPTNPDARQPMARLTGNYKRGNERMAASHPRNRK